MLSKISFWWLSSSIVLLGLAGCAEFDQRKGLTPIIDSTAVQTASNNKYWILNALAEDANVHAGDSDYYYLVTEAGFNYVDDQCRSYFDSLFFLQRHREELKSGLAASAATTAAILGITHAAVPTLTIVAAAFGLASNATDIVAGTYLYAQPPATTQGFVEKLQLAYREAAAANSTRINTPTSAYYHIQRYLNLCLPPTIEAEITKQISSTTAFPVQTGGGAFFSIETTSPPPASPRRFIGSPIGGQGATGNGSITGKTRVARTLPHDFGLPGAVTPSEKQMPAEELSRIQQNVLCVNPTKEFDQLTRDGITIFKQTRLIDPATSKIEDELDRKALIDAGRSGKKCPLDARNFYELRSYFSGGKLQPDRVKELQHSLNARPEGGPIDENGKLERPTREKIAAVRQGMKDLTDLPSAKQQVTQPFDKELRR